MKSTNTVTRSLFCPFTLCIPGLALEPRIIRQGHILEMLFLGKSCCIIHTPLLDLEKSQRTSKRNSKYTYNRPSQALPSLSVIPFHLLSTPTASQPGAPGAQPPRARTPHLTPSGSFHSLLPSSRPATAHS